MYRIRNEASSPLVLSLSPVLQSKAAVRSLFFSPFIIPTPQHSYAEAGIYL
jgi:hypothetical protein